jgi:hypothetical protein
MREVEDTTTPFVAQVSVGYGERAINRRRDPSHRSFKKVPQTVVANQQQAIYRHN